MAKAITKKIKLQIPAGKATPAPPVGTVLGPAGINLQEFCTKFNDATRDKMGDVLPVEISIYEDRTFDFVLKTPPTATLLLKAAGIDKGSKKGANEIVATISKEDVKLSLKECGVSESNIAKFGIDFDETFGFEAELHPKNVIDNKDMETTIAELEKILLKDE